MADLCGKVKNALDEARILVLGVQVLLGFQFRAFMEPGFPRLPPSSQALELVGLVLLLGTMALLLLPVARHRLVEQGSVSTHLIGFTMSSVAFALLPFAVVLGMDIYVAVEHVAGQAAGAAMGAIASTLAVGLWFVLPRAKRAHRPAPDEDDIMQKPELSDRIVEVLTEARVVLPGAQALLGFQLAMVLMDAFEKLPSEMKSLHIASFCFIAAAIALLMAPAAWHRIAERGEDTERFEKFASAMVLSSMVALAGGLSLELTVVAARWSHSSELAFAMGGACLLALLALWFGLTAIMRARFRPMKEERAG